MQLDQFRGRACALEVELADMKEDDEAKGMRLEYFKTMLEDKEREIKDLTESID